MFRRIQFSSDLGTSSTADVAGGALTVYIPMLPNFFSSEP